jgi:simple sugar transport system ATP-binding protein
LPRERAPLAHAPASAEVIFALHDAAWRDARGIMRLQPTSLTVRRGEILGVLGVEGSGQAELLRLLAGRLEPTQGRAVHPKRVGFVPADRLHEAVIPAMTATENQVLADAGTLRGRIDWSARARATASVLSTYEVRAAGPTATLDSLSGGNQQKFVVGRERDIAPNAIVAENPTRGLDVRASARVLGALRAVAESGDGAAVVFSTDLDEVLALTQRVVVCFAGTVTEIDPPAEPGDRRAYARALLGVHA